MRSQVLSISLLLWRALFIHAARFQQEDLMSLIHAGQSKEDEGTHAELACCCKHHVKAEDCKYGFHGQSIGICCQKFPKGCPTFSNYWPEEHCPPHTPIKGVTPLPKRCYMNYDSQDGTVIQVCTADPGPVTVPDMILSILFKTGEAALPQGLVFDDEPRVIASDVPGKDEMRKILTAGALSILSTAPRPGDLLHVSRSASMDVIFRLSDDRIIRVRPGSNYELTGMEVALLTWSGQGEEFLASSMTSGNFKAAATWVNSQSLPKACSEVYDVKVE